MQAHSFTSSSETAEVPAGNLVDYRALAWFLVGCVGVLAVFDLGVGATFATPAKWDAPVGSLNRYFNYFGESIEGKLEYTTGVDGEEPSPIIQAGWIKTELYAPSEDWDSGGKRFVVYGMSFTNRIAEQMKEIDPSLAILSRGGPSAPLSHSFSLFEADPQRREADHVVVGILSSSIPHLQSLSGQGFTFESPAPYTFPQFRVQEDRLERIDPVIKDRDRFVELCRHRGPEWYSHLESLRKYDLSWSGFMFRKSILDKSVLAKLVRRAWGKRVIGLCQDRVYSAKTGYKTDEPVLAAVPMLLGKMHEMCVKDGQELTVVLLHAIGEPGHLDAWLKQDLRERGIHVVSTTDIFNSLDAMNFESGNHFLPRLDHQIAESVIEQTLGPGSR